MRIVIHDVMMMSLLYSSSLSLMPFPTYILPAAIDSWFPTPGRRLPCRGKCPFYFVEVGRSYSQTFEEESGNETERLQTQCIWITQGSRSPPLCVYSHIVDSLYFVLLIAYLFMVHTTVIVCVSAVYVY